MENKNILENHEERIKALESKINELTKKPELLTTEGFSFSDKKRGHNKLLEQLLKSDYCHSHNGLSFEEILEVFRLNGRPVDSKKLRDLLGIWKKRKKIEAVKEAGSLRYFWIDNG